METPMAGTKQKATFALDKAVIEALDEAVAAGAAPSKNALVERAVRAELRAIRHQEERRRWQEAARDPIFMQDIADVERDFRWADAETLRDIE